MAEPKTNELGEQLARLTQQQAAFAESLSDKYELLQAGISERYSHIERKLEKLSADMDKRLDKINGLLIGDDGRGGMIVRLDRLEQSEERRSRFMWAIATASIAALAGVIKQLFTGH